MKFFNKLGLRILISVCKSNVLMTIWGDYMKINEGAEITNKMNGEYIGNHNCRGSLHLVHLSKFHSVIVCHDCLFRMRTLKFVDTYLKLTIFCTLRTLLQITIVMFAICYILK